MLRTTQLIEWGAAKINSARMMRARGHVLPALETELIDSDASPTQVIAEYAARALELGCSLCEAMSGTYDVARERDHVWEQGRAPDVTSIVFLDDNWDETKRRSKAASTDQLKQALDAARRAPRPHDQILNVIIIAPTALTSDARREITNIGAVLEGGSAMRTLGGDAARVRVMLARDLSIPICSHVGVPTHNRLSQTDALRLVAECRVHPLQLSILATSDAVAIHYDYRESDIVKITREASVEFRVVARDLS
jgi:DNA-directed RNA polymerase subunit H (RpoH/RPB5)